MPRGRFCTSAMEQSWVVVPGMYRTHCKHYSLIPPLVSNNNLALLRCEYMCVGTLVYIPRHLSKISNNNKRCQLIIHCLFSNWGHMDLDYGNVRYMVYDVGFLVWIIPSTYLSHKGVNWVISLVLLYLLSSGFISDF